MEAAVRWSPHATADEQRFLLADVTDSSLTLNQVDSLSKRNRSISYHSIARCAKLPPFSAFDWSRTDESVVALGLGTGSASLVKLRESGSEVTTTFRLKQQRKCNSVSFSAQDWLAVGVDKTRSDICLFIYDAARGGSATPTSTSAKNQSQSQEPIRRLCAAEVVSSVRFFSSQPQELVAGTQRACVRLFDLRDPSQSPQAPTRNVNNIAIDPLDENCFASAGSTDDPSVTVWDKRWLSASGGAVFDFKPAVNNHVKTTVWSMRFSGSRRGRLAIGSSTGELKIIDMTQSKVTSDPNSEMYFPPNPYGGAAAWNSNRYVQRTRVLEPAYHEVRKGEEYEKRIVAYDWIQNYSNDFEQAILALRPNREVDVLTVPSAPRGPIADITSLYDFSIGFDDLSITEAAASAERPALQIRTTGSPEDFGPYDHPSKTEEIIDGTADGSKLTRASPRLAQLLSASTIQRERCRQGYLFDCPKNIKLVSGNWHLERLWEIVNRFRTQASEDGMMHSGLDLAYIGVQGLWSEEINTGPHRHPTRSPGKPDEAIIGLNAAKEIPNFEGERTHFPEHRQLCLAVCGWKFTPDTLEAECHDLIDRGLYYQAIVQAVLHDYKHIALNLLRTLIRSKTIPNIGLGPLLAMEGKVNEEQSEMCLWMAADTDDNALKALLTFLSTGNWRDVMKTNYLHLGYRLALGLKYLNDTELSGFLQLETARAVRNGDLEGILLTGLAGREAMDLFQTYIAKTNDLQTAVLATAFTHPRYGDDVRWAMWKETYFYQMQAWKCFIERAKFTIQHNRMAVTRNGKSLVEPQQSRLELICVHCQGSLATTSNSNPKTNGTHAGPSPATTVDPTVCPRCGRHLPRCGVCQLWLGTERKVATISEDGGNKKSEIWGRLVTFCARCKHAAHADHSREWFAKHAICPVVGCECACGVGLKEKLGRVG